jgi:hypothetical protein
LFTCPLYCHDASLIHTFSMLTMLSVLQDNIDLLRPV